MFERKKVTYALICVFVLFYALYAFAWLHLREKKLLICLFAFLCFCMSFMLLLGCIFVPFVPFMHVKSFCKKKNNNKV